MKGYFSRLIQQTGIKLDQQGENNVYSHQESDNTLVQPPVTPDPPETLEIEEFIKVTPPSGSMAPNHHETAKSVDEDKLKPAAILDRPKTLEIEGFIEVTVPPDAVAPNHLEVAKSVKREPSSPPEALQERKSPSSPEIIIPPKPVQAEERQEIREMAAGPAAAEPANIDTTKTDVSPLNKKLETKVEHQPQTRSHEKERLAAEPPVTEPSMNSETAVSPSPASLEQHVVISQLPGSYQKVIKEWLVSPADEGRDQPTGREKLKASIKRKQNSRVILKPKPAKDDSLPDKKSGNEQLKTRDLHLSVGNINLTIEEPEPVNRQSPKISNKPARRQQSGSSRLSRHYVRVR